MRCFCLKFFAAAALVFANSECLPCHEKQVAAHAATNHARSLRPILETEFFGALPDRPLGEARGGFLLHYERAGETIRVTAERGSERLSGVIRWAFGAGDQGITPVVQVNRKYLEHRISYYARVKKFDLTLGHSPGISLSPLRALGVPQEPATIRQCFGCHSTGLAESIEEFTPGVQCLRCHLDAGEHARTGIPLKSALWSTHKAVVGFCAQCHRLSPASEDATDPLNIRFQPYRLVMSACYRKGELSCLTCHDPHSNARRGDPAFYNTRCVSCHASQKSKGDCVGCHMPRSAPHPYLAFTDHFIRVIQQ